MKNFDPDRLANSLWVAQKDDHFFILQFIESCLNDRTNERINLTMLLYQTNSIEKSIQSFGTQYVFVNETLNERIHKFIFKGNIFMIVLSEDFTRILGNGLWFIPSGDKFADFESAITRYQYFC